MARIKGIFEMDGKWWHFVRHGSKTSSICDESGNMVVVPTSKVSGVKLRDRQRVHDERMRESKERHAAEEAAKSPPTYEEDVAEIQRLRDKGLLIERVFREVLEIWEYKVLRQARPDEREEIMLTFHEYIAQQLDLTAEFDRAVRFLNPQIVDIELKKLGLSRAYEMDSIQRDDMLRLLLRDTTRELH